MRRPVEHNPVLGRFAGNLNLLQSNRFAENTKAIWSAGPNRKMRRLMAAAQKKKGAGKGAPNNSL